MKQKSIVLLSGGLDSVVNSKIAHDETEIFLILTFDYGQAAVKRETEASLNIAKKYGIPFKTIRLDFLSELDSGLTKGKFPEFDPVKLDDHNYSLKTAGAVWVPNRNGVFISIAAAFADRHKIDRIVVGFNKEEGATFPDNTPEFMEETNHALEYSTQNRTKVTCYTSDLDKKSIVSLGMEKKAPFEFIWSCYSGGEKMCGKCESCKRLIRALEENAYLESFTKINFRGFR